MAGWVVGARSRRVVLMFWMHPARPTPLGGPPSLFEGPTARTSSTCRRSPARPGCCSGRVPRSGGVRGAGRTRRPRHRAGTSIRSVRRALAMLACIAAVAHVTAGYVYQWLLPLVSILSLVAIMVAVHPAAVGMRRYPVVAAARRDRQAELRPVPVELADLRDRRRDRRVGRPVRVGMMVTAVASELCTASSRRRSARAPSGSGGHAGSAADRRASRRWCALLGLLAFYSTSSRSTRRGRRRRRVRTRRPTIGERHAATPAVDAAATGHDARDAGVDQVCPNRSCRHRTVLPRHVAIVGDSQAHALAINLPDGIGDTFVITDGSSRVAACTTRVA